MTHYNYIDVLFRGYGVERFGFETMKKITDNQVEKARIYSFKTLENLIKKEGYQESGTLKNLFCDFIKENYL